MKEFIRKLYCKKNFGKRLFLVIAAVITMGFSLSWLVQVNFGTDPFTSLNLAVAEKIGIPMGHWQAGFNTFLFLFVIFLGREYIGFGTIANMFLVGYSLDFFSGVWARVLPTGFFDSMPVRIAVLIPALAVFIFAVAVYIDVELGTAPYDAIPFMLDKYQSKLSFRLLRGIYDCSYMAAAWLLGAKIGVVTLVIAFTLGPIITYVGEWLRPVLGMEE